MSAKPQMAAAVKAAEKDGFGNLDEILANLPRVDEQTTETITENTILINSRCSNPRMKFVCERLVYHLHTFAKEVNLQTNEWMAGIDFLTKTGHKCSDIRQEFILLSDVLGLSTLVDAMSNPKPTGCTESTVLGPFHTHDAVEIEHGASIVSTPGGNLLIIEGKVTDINGNGIKDAQIDVWETDKDGFYDVQYTDRKGPDNRGIITTDKDGKYKFEAIVPVAYGIPSDGPVAVLLKKLDRHCFRPAHIHFKIDVEGYEQLITALFLREDPFVTSDVVFGVKNSLIIDLIKHDPDESHPKPWWTLEKDFVLPTLQEISELKTARLDQSRLAP